jgi:hypothetical protein
MDDAIEALAPSPKPAPASPAPAPTQPFLVKAVDSALGRRGVFVELTDAEAARPLAAVEIVVPTPEQLAMKPPAPTEVFDR